MIRINGKPLGGGDSEPAASDTSGLTEPGARAPAAKPQPPPVTSRSISLAAGFSPNPTIIPNLGGRSDDDLFLKYKIQRGCEGYITPEPGAVIDLAAPLSNVKLSAPGAGVLYVRFAGKYLCSSPDAVGVVPTLTASLPAGRVEVFAGHYHSKKQFRYEIEIEDLTRDRDLGWDTTGKPIVLDKLPTKAIVAAVAIPAAGETPRGVMSCGFTGHFRKDPDLTMTLSRPLAGLELQARSTARVQILLMGPIPDDGRDIPGLCYEEGNAKTGRLEAGRYAIKLATFGEAAAATVVVRGPDTPRDPLMVAAVPDQLAIDDRRAIVHFPQLVEDDVWKDDALRQKLVAAAPRPLFVFPRFDLDETTAQLELRVGGTMEVAPPEGATWAWPKKDEPLLPLARGFYIATDGSIFALNAKDLAPAPSGPIHIPARARNPGLGFGYSVNAAGKDDKARVDAYYRASQKSADCSDRVWEPYANKIAALQREAYSDARQERIAGLERTARDKAWAQCGASKVDAHRARLWKELMASRTARRAAALAGIRKRLLGLFPR